MIRCPRCPQHKVRYLRYEGESSEPVSDGTADSAEARENRGAEFVMFCDDCTQVFRVRASQIRSDLR